jgi:hypothetical protein
MKTRKRGEHWSTYSQRCAWLELHAKELEGMTHNQIVRAMQKAELISPSTYVRDVVLPAGWKTKTDEVEEAREKEMEEVIKRPVQR